MYKSKTTAQYLTSCDSFYDDNTRRTRLKNIYFILKKRLLSLNRPSKLLYFSGSYESSIAWVIILMMDLVPETWKVLGFRSCFLHFLPNFWHIWWFFQSLPTSIFKEEGEHAQSQVHRRCIETLKNHQIPMPKIYQKLKESLVPTCPIFGYPKIRFSVMYPIPH